MVEIDEAEYEKLKKNATDNVVVLRIVEGIMLLICIIILSFVVGVPRYISAELCGNADYIESIYKAKAALEEKEMLGMDNDQYIEYVKSKGE